MRWRCTNFLLCVCFCRVLWVWGKNAVSWRELIGRPHYAAEHFATLCHLKILDCTSPKPYDSSHSSPLIVSFEITDDAIPFHFLAVQRLSIFTEEDMVTFWKYPTPHSIISLSTERHCVVVVHDRIASMLQAHSAYKEKILLETQMQAFRIINSTLHSLCDENFTLPLVKKSHVSILVADYLSHTRLMERRSALCRQHFTNTSRYVIDQTHYGLSQGDMLYVLESRASDVYGEENEMLLVRDIVAIPSNASLSVLDVIGGIMSTISLRCDESVDEINCSVDHSANYMYSCLMVMLSAGMSLSPIDTNFANKDPPHMLSIGLGGGRFHMYAINHHPALHVDTVEISANMLQVAQTYFDFAACDVISAKSDKSLREFMSDFFISSDCRSRVVVADGFAFLVEAVTQKKVYDFIVVDMFDTRVVEYTGDSGVGDGNIVTPELLRNVALALHPSRGVALIYLIDDAMYDSHVLAIRRLFKRVIHLSASRNAHILAVSHWEDLGIAPDKQYKAGESNFDVSYLADRVEKYATSHGYDNRLVYEYKYALTVVK